MQDPKGTPDMATPALPPTDNNETFMLDLDPPAWLATLLVAIGAIVPLPPEIALAALQALVRPYSKGGPERERVEALSKAHRALLTEAYNAKFEAIQAARSAPSASAPPPATERQAIPVVTDAPSAPVLSVPVVRPATWVPLMAQGASFRPATGSEKARRVSPDMWGARVDHDPTDPVTVGTVLRVQRANGGQSQRKTVTGIVHSEPGVAYVTVRDTTDADMAPRPRVAAGSAPVVTVRDERTAPVINTPEGAIPLSSLMPDAIPASMIPAALRDDTAIQGLASEIAAVESALANIATEGANIATAQREAAYVEPTTRGNGSASVDSGASIGIFALPRAQRAFVPTNATRGATLTERQRLLSERDLIAGAIAADGWLQVSWTGAGSTEHGKVTDGLIAIERESDAPGVPSAEHYAGLAVDTLRGRDWDVKRLSKSATPAGVKATWLVGRALGGDRAALPGDAYGTAELFVDLVEGDAESGLLKFRGNPRLADMVRDAYSASVASVALTSRVLTPWLGRVLRTRHGAVKRGHVWYVPPGHATAVRALIAAISPLWGDHETISVTTGPDLFSSLTRGLTVEAQAIADDYAEQTIKAREAAREKAREKAAKRHNASEAYIDAEGEAAYKRATVSPTIAARLLREIGTVAARVAGYETVLGAESVTNAKALINDLRRALEPLTDDTALRGAMLELE
jgi:hypothetical protein